MRVLVVEDYPPLRSSIAQGLREQGYAVDEADDGEEALWRLREVAYDVVVLDLMIPGLDGLSVLRRARAEDHSAAVLVLTAKDAVPDRIAGLDAGADDYLVKPFAFEELCARVRALVRRAYRAPDGRITIGDLIVDTSRRRVSRAGAHISLSAREYALLEYLALRRGAVVTRQELWDHIYDFATEPGSNVIDVHVSHVRKKIDHGFEPKLLRTQRGLGYVLEAPC